MLKRVFSRAVLTRSFFIPQPAAAITARYVPTFSQRHTRFFASTAANASQDPSDASINKSKELFEEGSKRWSNNDLEGAAAAYKEAITHFPSSDSYYNLGTCLYSLGKTEEAIAAWQSCLVIDPTETDAHVNLANVYATFLKKPEMALEHYEIATGLNPEDGEVQYNYGVVLDSMGKLSEAIEQYERAVTNGVDQAQKNLASARERLSAKLESKEK
ncbi:hypothetical protein BDR26DRAFT_865328 [Obelidium mucronatum]|nr:hypothetical protein BDR26DRAFT_865328 [Obelidium mucronatum]